MKKSRLLLLILFLGLIGAFWLLKSADTKHLKRQDVTIEIQDTFEK